MPTPQHRPIQGRGGRALSRRLFRITEIISILLQDEVVVLGGVAITGGDKIRRLRNALMVDNVRQGDAAAALHTETCRHEVRVTTKESVAVNAIITS